MGTGVPLLNDYKQEFFAKRFPQTILGGPKFKLGYDAPVYVYLNQVVIFLIPFIFGGLFTLLVELSILPDHVAVFVYGALMFVFVIVTQIVATLVQMKKDSDIYPTKKNLLSEEDEIDFMSCCGVETFEFVVPAKKYKINILFHAAVSGPMCGLVLWYLLPTTLNVLYSYNVGATVVLFAFGWFTLSVAQYSLTVGAPPELATFHTLDTYEITPLMRPFYVYVCVAFDLIDRYTISSDILLANQVLHIVLVCLPVLWMLGVLSPLDAFFLWLFEQVHMFLLGGSPVASDIRLVVMLLFSIGTFLGAYFITISLGTVVLSACMGYLLSTDLGGLGAKIISFVRFRNKVSSSPQFDSGSDIHSKAGFLWSWGVLEFLYHFIMLLIVGGEAGTLNYFSTQISSDVWKILGYILIGLCVFEKIFRDIQGVYIIFGLWRNMLFPSSLTRSKLFTKRKARLKPLGIIRRVIVNWVGPFVMVAYLSLTITSTDPLTVSSTGTRDVYMAVWYTFGIVRVFRWTWQSTPHSMLELSIVHIILIALPSNPTVVSFGVPVLSLITGLCRDRFYQLMNKLYFFFTMIITAWADKKQRRRSTAIMIFVSLVLFPLVLVVIVASTVISAPLLPLFTLPIFLIGFPRPERMWPERVGASANICQDTVFYRQFAPQFAKALRIGFANGSMGDAHPGSHYLVRFQDRLMWLMILERGAGFCTVSLKGLELQETSCHTAEAARLDDVFELAFEREKGFVLGSINQYPIHAITPVDAANVKTYSDARNVLTGIIDNPNSFQMAMSAFIKSLVWVLLHHVNKVKKKQKEKDKVPKETVKKQTQKVLSSIETEKHEMEEINHNHHMSTSAKVAAKDVPSIDSILDDRISPRPKSSRSTNKNKNKNRKSSITSSIHSFTDSIWSDDGLFSSDDKSKKGASNLRTKSPLGASKTPVKYGASNKWTPKPTAAHDDIDDLIEEIGFGMPVVDVTKPKIPAPTQSSSVRTPGKKQMSGSTIYKPVTNLAGSPDFKCPYSSHISLPPRWRELPIESSRLSQLLEQFPRDWYRHVLTQLDWTEVGQPTSHVVTEVTLDDALLNCYAQLTMACFSIFDAQVSYNSAGYLYKYYIGDIPWNAMLDWLSEDKELHSLVVKSFRYGFKLMLDQILLGEASTPEELQEYLEEYDRDWYIGLEKDPQWNSAILASTPNLFSIGQNTTQGTYGSRTLTLQDVAVSVGRLNPAVVRGQWANLSLELLYFTNDDEERYSIQAHPTILRNMTVQSADPPLGYPIFASEPISVPTL